MAFINMCIRYYILLLYLCNNYIIVNGHMKGDIYGGFGPDGLFRAVDSVVYNRRVCTECKENFPECETTFWKLYDQYGEPWLNLEITNDTKPYQLSTSNLYVSCWKSDLTNAKRRRKRTPQKDNTINDKRNRRQKRFSSGEINTDAVGRVYINTVYFGVDFYNDCSVDTRFDSCYQNAMPDKWYMVECNLDYSCTAAGVPKWLNYCDMSSVFLHVEYQCVPEDYIFYMDPSDISFAQPYDEVSSSSAYIISPNYPYYYPHDSSFECRIEAAQFATFSFYVLDFHVEEELPSGCCGYDWLEFQKIENEQITERTRFCNDHLPGHMLDIEAKEIRLVFRSDGGHKERGFWLQFNVTVGGSFCTAQVECDYFDRFSAYELPELADSADDYYDSPICTDEDYYSGTGSTTPVDVIASSAPTAESQDDSLSITMIGIIVGAVAGALLLIILIVVIVCCVRKSRSTPEKHNTQDPISVNNKQINNTQTNIANPYYSLNQKNQQQPASNRQNQAVPTNTNPSSYEYIPGGYLEPVSNNDNRRIPTRQNNTITDPQYEDLPDITHAKTRMKTNTGGVSNPGYVPHESPAYLDMTRNGNNGARQPQTYDYVDPSYEQNSRGVDRQQSEMSRHVYQELQ